MKVVERMGASSGLGGGHYTMRAVSPENRPEPSLFCGVRSGLTDPTLEPG